MADTRAQFGPSGQRELLLGQLHRLAMPTLVVWGERDRILPVHHAGHAQARLERGRLAIIPDCGHAAWLERPGRLAQVLNEFLDEGGRG